MENVIKNLLLLISLFFCFPIVHAHTFAAPYSLPVPFWMYAYGASAALILSFVIVGLLSGINQENRIDSDACVSGKRNGYRLSRKLIFLLQIISVSSFFLTVLTGLFGVQNPYLNFNMTFFWIVFVMGFTYSTAIVGDVYQFINPFKVIFSALQVCWPNLFKERWNLNASWGCYPALILYMAFIWLELFAHTTPYTLSVALLSYAVISFIGSWVFGFNKWFRDCEFFSVFFRLIGMIAPVRYFSSTDSKGKLTIRVKFRLPFVGLLEERAEYASTVVFILFMLSSTAYDGLHHTEPWSRLFWAWMYPLVDPVVQLVSSQPYVLAAKFFSSWQVIAMFLSPFIYLVFYIGILYLTKVMTRSEESLMSLSMRFAHSLVPIAFVYHFTHYYTLLLSQGFQIFQQISDPFGLGWNLFGTSQIQIEPLLIDVDYIWHTQVGLILVGHIVSVYLAHMEALKIFQNGIRAMTSQLPMLLLMVGLTSAGLWIMSLPLGQN